MLRPGVLWFLRNLNDPDFNPVQEMIHLPIYRHLRRFILSVVSKELAQPNMSLVSEHSAVMQAMRMQNKEGQPSGFVCACFCRWCLDPLFF